ncbi:MAG: N-acetylmuramoyl-L-alanine amidase, partial [Ardenticatenaceae bacterium]
MRAIQRSLLSLLVLLAWPIVVHAQQDSPSTLAATFEVRPQAVQGFELEDGIPHLGSLYGSFVSEVFEPGWEFIAVGVTWQRALPAGVTPLLEVRVGADGQAWSEWIALPRGEDDAPDGVGATFTHLLFVQGRQVQLRAALANLTGQMVAWEGLRLTVIDGRPGPTAQELRAQMGPSSPEDGPTIISRQQWGADESLRFDSYGNEIWPREYYSMRAFFVHHTASAPSEPDPAAAVRSIYYYHAVTNGWGDMGYHYVIDQYSNIYHGRYGAEENGLVVEGGHALGYNRNTMGISVIGNFVSAPPGGASVQALKDLLTHRAVRYTINPLASVLLDGVGDISPDRWFDDSILGHRDSHNPPRTTCPGDALYALLPEIRGYVYDLVTEPPVVSLASPPDHSLLDGMFSVRADTTDNVVRVEYFLDGSLIAASNAPPWSAQVDSRSLPAGGYILRAEGRTAYGTIAGDEHTVTIAVATPGGESMSPLRQASVSRDPAPPATPRYSG